MARNTKVEEMRLTEALNTVKLLEKRIPKEIMKLSTVAAITPRDTKINGLPIDEYTKNAQASMQSVTDLIDRLNKIRAAIVQANATTMVTAGGITMSLAQAIWYKTDGIKNLQKYVSRLSDNYEKVTMEIIRHNSDLSDMADTFVENLFGNKDSKAEDIDAARKSYIDSNTKTYGGADVKSEIDKVSELITNFQCEINTAIDVANATTMITI